MKNEDVWSREPETETKSSLCSDKNCQSTRCFKKFTRCVNTKSPVRPKPSDDKNCHSVQFMWPVKPNSDVQLTEPAVYSNTRKMQSDPKKRPQMESTQMSDSSVKRLQSNQSVSQEDATCYATSGRLSPDITSTTKASTEKKQKC